jgi:hypothetical protein
MARLVEDINDTSKLAINLNINRSNTSPILAIPKKGRINADMEPGISSKVSREEENSRKLLDKKVNKQRLWPHNGSKSGNLISTCLGNKSPISVIPPVKPNAKANNSDQHRNATLSDFIEDDSSFLSEQDSEYDTVTPHQRKGTRRLVQGRRPSRDPSSEAEDRESMQPESSTTVNVAHPATDLQLEAKSVMLNVPDHSPGGGIMRNYKGSTRRVLKLMSRDQTGNSDMDGPFAL